VKGEGAKYDPKKKIMRIVATIMKQAVTYICRRSSKRMGPWSLGSPSSSERDFEDPKEP